jgi:hypothetical protein
MVNVSTLSAVFLRRRDLLMTRLRPLLLAVVTAAVLFAARPALAGPPLLCFPFDIGAARSLPMGAGGWRATDPKYDVAHLVDDTIALLVPSTPVVVRMETLRRATIYAAGSPAVAQQLLATLQARAAVPTADAPLAVFDFGYLVETYRQARFMFTEPIPALDRIDGYQLVLKAQALARNDDMGHAAQLIAGNALAK